MGRLGGDAGCESPPVHGCQNISTVSAPHATHATVPMMFFTTTTVGEA